MTARVLLVLELALFVATGCTAQISAQYRDPRTGIIVEECLKDQPGWGGPFAAISQGNEFAACKSQAEARTPGGASL